MSFRDSPYDERLAMLGWSSLQSRRSYLSFLECYMTIHGLNGFNCTDYFEFNCYGETRSNHSFKLRQSLATVNCFLHSFFVRIIKQWNALPKEIVYEQDFSIFRSKLRMYRKILLIFFSRLLIILKFYIVVHLFYILYRECSWQG